MAGSLPVIVISYLAVADMSVLLSVRRPSSASGGIAVSFR